MRILFVNDGALDAGGVTTYLDAVGRGLQNRGHDVGYLYCSATQTGEAVAPFTTVQFQADAAAAGHDVLPSISNWQPDVVYSHNMRPLELERRLLDHFPVVKFMHGYFGTCVSGLKMHAFPAPQPCDRLLGLGCLGLYFPRRCGQFSLTKLARQYRWAVQQQELFSRYRAVVVASRHMGEEFVRNGVPSERVFVNPLFTPGGAIVDQPPAGRVASDIYRLLFLGRMTKLKGGDLLLHAVAEASPKFTRPVRLVLGGDGPQRAHWERLARSLGVMAEFPGWLAEGARTKALQQADLLVVPSVWPEPFGFVGLEAARFGVPAVAFDVGGISEWLEDGVNGVLIRGKRPDAQALATGLSDLLAVPNRLAGLRQGARAIARRMSLNAHLDRLEVILANARRTADEPLPRMEHPGS